jgi:hypothetical protein
MGKTRVVLETGMPQADDPHDAFERARAVARAWDERRTIEWRMSLEDVGTRTPTHPTRHTVVLAAINAGEREDGTRLEILRMAMDVQTSPGEDPMVKALRVLDMRRVAGPADASDDRSSEDATEHTVIVPLAGPSVIGRMDSSWPVGRTLTAYSSSDASGDTRGMSGWQLNGGSWIVLPLPGAWVTLTIETVMPTADRSVLEVQVDSMTLTAPPETVDGFPPLIQTHQADMRTGDLPDLATERPVVTAFEADRRGFRMEAGDRHRLWRFEMADDLPRPPHAASGRPRTPAAGEDVGASWVMAHDMHFES